MVLELQRPAVAAVGALLELTGGATTQHKSG